MFPWWTDAYCAWWAKTYQDMPLLWKALETSSYILAPVCFAITAYYGEAGWVRDAYWVMSGLFLLLFISIIIYQRRGYFALLRGVQPAPPKAVLSTDTEKLLLLIWLVMCLVLGAIELIRPAHLFSSESFSNLAWTLGMFFLQLASYVRSRFARAPESSEPQAA